MVLLETRMVAAFRPWFLAILVTLRAVGSAQD